MAVCSVSLLRNLSLYSSVANLTISLQPSLNSVWRKQKASHLSLKKGEIYFFNSISAKSKIIQLFEKKIDCCALSIVTREHCISNGSKTVFNYYTIDGDGDSSYKFTKQNRNLKSATDSWRARHRNFANNLRNNSLVMKYVLLSIHKRENRRINWFYLISWFIFQLWKRSDW